MSTINMFVYTVHNSLVIYYIISYYALINRVLFLRIPNDVLSNNLIMII